MAFTLEGLETELGLAPGTLTAKKEVAAKYNGYLAEADTKYTSATEAQKQAQAALDAVKNEQAAIDEKIKSFSLTEAQVDTLRANYAALEAQAKALKAQGYNLNIPETPAAPAKTEFDPNRFQQDVNGSLVAGFNLMNKHQRIFGKALPDDLDALAREAAAARVPFMQYAEQKYGFAAEEAKQKSAALQADKDAYAAQKVKEYQEAHPVTAGNHDLVTPGASRFPELAKRPTPQKHENYGGTPAQRIARSVKRSLEGLAAAS